MEILLALWFHLGFKHYGRFPFNQSFPFEFLVTSSGEWNKFFKNFQKEDNLARYTQISDNFSRKFSFHSILLPEFLEL